MMFVTKMRWRIERYYQDLKQGFRLGRYEEWGGRGFHHHATLSIATYAFLMAQRLKAGRSDAGRKKLRPTAGTCRSQGLRPSGRPALASVTLASALGYCLNCKWISPRLRL